MIKSKSTMYFIDERVLRFSKDKKLTYRETEIFWMMILTGYDNKKIAESLGIATNTVKNNIYSLLKKVNVESTRDLLCMIVRELLDKRSEKEANYNSRPL